MTNSEQQLKQIGDMFGFTGDDIVSYMRGVKYGMEMLQKRVSEMESKISEADTLLHSAENIIHNGVSDDEVVSRYTANAYSENLQAWMKSND